MRFYDNILSSSVSIKGDTSLKKIGMKLGDEIAKGFETIEELETFINLSKTLKIELELQDNVAKLIKDLENFYLNVGIDLVGILRKYNIGEVDLEFNNISKLDDIVIAGSSLSSRTIRFGLKVLTLSNELSTTFNLDLGDSLDKIKRSQNFKFDECSDFHLDDDVVAEKLFKIYDILEVDYSSKDKIFEVIEYCRYCSDRVDPVNLVQAIEIALNLGNNLDIRLKGFLHPHFFDENGVNEMGKLLVLYDSFKNIGSVYKGGGRFTFTVEW